MTLLKTTFVISLTALVAGLSGCSSSDTTSSPSSPGSSTAGEITADEAKKKATAIVPGEAFYAHDIVEGEEKLYDVRVRLSGGQEVKVVLFRDDGELDEIEAEEGPFDYDLPAPSAGLLTLAAARSKALDQKAGNVTQWEFHAEKKEWEFYVRDTGNQLWEIKLAGDTGAMASVEAVEKAD